MKAYCNNQLILSNVIIADTFFSRFKGLLGRKSINTDEGLLLKNCSSIHCFFMKFTIDAVYLSEDMEVLYKETIKPWGIGKIIKNTRHILEIPENASQAMQTGGRIICL